VLPELLGLRRRELLLREPQGLVLPQRQRMELSRLLAAWERLRA
jgi:hypothetical protein